ncbi:MAG TPA: nuclear transport factor 2 family protein [Gammaproteobacteria bacterium]|nr:nuclear transport factor 2 family protein [Gammaproteobacteria bacterium]
MLAPCLVLGGSLGLVACSEGPSPEEAQQLAALEAQIEALEQRKSLIEDANDIKRLQRAYGYYVDEALWDQVADLFAADGTIEIGLDGVYAGKARVREYLYALGGGRQGLADGQLNEHMQVMPVITVAPDGMTAKGRWRAIIMAGELGESTFWGEGPYENEYVKEDGVWKIKTLHWYQSMFVPYEAGWQTNPDPTGGKFVSSALPPDSPPSVEYKTWPDTYLPPFHFPNPVGTYVADPAAGGTP